MAISIGSAVFAQLATESPYTLQWAAASSHSKLPIHMRGSGPHLIHASLGPPQAHNLKTSRSIQLFLNSSRLWQRDRQTTLWCVTTGHFYIRSTAMQPKKWQHHRQILSTLDCFLPAEMPLWISTWTKPSWLNVFLFYLSLSGAMYCEMPVRVRISKTIRPNFMGGSPNWLPGNSQRPSPEIQHFSSCYQHWTQTRWHGSEHDISSTLYTGSLHLSLRLKSKTLV